MSDNNSDLGAFLAGFVIGGLVGAATAMILAPKSGAELRAQIRTAANADELYAAGQERLAYARERGGAYVGSVRDASATAQERARIVLDEGKSKASTALQSSKERASKLGENLTQRIKRDNSANGDAVEAE